MKIFNFFKSFFSNNNKSTPPKITDAKASDENQEVDIEKVMSVFNQIGNQSPYDFDILKKENWVKVAEQITKAYLMRHFPGASDDQVILYVSSFLRNRAILRSLFTNHPELEKASIPLLNCKDNPIIRGWGADLFGRTCDVEKMSILTNALLIEKDQGAAQEIVASFTKILRFKDNSVETKKIIENSVNLYLGSNKVTSEGLDFALRLLFDELKV